MTSTLTVNRRGQSDFLDSEAGTWQDRRRNRNQSSSRLLEEYIVDQESEENREDTALVHGLSPSSLHGSSNVWGGAHIEFPSASSTATFPWPDETVPPFFDHDAEEASGLEPFASKYNWTLPTYRAQPMDVRGPMSSINSNGEQLRDADANTYSIYAQPCSTDTHMSGASNEAMNLDLLTTSVHEASCNPTNALDARLRPIRDRDREWARLSENADASSTGNPTRCNHSAETESGIKMDTKFLSVSEIQHRRIQELSKLAMGLYAQLAANDPENHQPKSSAAATTFQDQLVGSVLESSNTFLTLLGSFSTPAQPSSPSPPSPPASTMKDKNTTYDSSDSGTSPSASAPKSDDHAVDESVQHSYGKLPADSSADSKPPPPIDMATVLQLLTCYIRIIHLHSIMHARILDYLSAFLQHNRQDADTVPPVFPDMQVGGVSLNGFGTFQINLLLQISVHVLGEIESALGLPKAFRIGRSNGERTGVLGASVSGEFVKCLMSEEAWSGRVERVREQLGHLRRALKRAFDL